MKINEQIRFHTFSLNKCGVHNYEEIKAMATKHINSTTAFSLLFTLNKVIVANEELRMANIQKTDVESELSSLSVALVNAYNAVRYPSLFKDLK